MELSSLFFISSYKPIPIIDAIIRHEPGHLIYKGSYPAPICDEMQYHLMSLYGKLYSIKVIDYYIEGGVVNLFYQFYYTT